ncbi:hypothetical protein [Francisella hispaniensis]|nr:hypothetical protein [Francisella hispaniensis]
MSCSLAMLNQSFVCLPSTAGQATLIFGSLSETRQTSLLVKLCEYTQPK